MKSKWMRRLAAVALVCACTAGVLAASSGSAIAGEYIADACQTPSGALATSEGWDSFSVGEPSGSSG